MVNGLRLRAWAPATMDRCLCTVSSDILTAQWTLFGQMAGCFEKSSCLGVLESPGNA
ncbi:hypothetical protein BCR44DRAFT_1423271 [Catenaria anguillulae PL171]|uniref:Uncharacterized protein n=1 Tax=Catenaria anguillulae PL171 TaxID=765915 RepID=A0A1Y2I6G5_9FUNG|nr:hypothetical protein BCR44DRAFT_1423271 [Catenaria anguillulae PL171]